MSAMATPADRKAQVRKPSAMRTDTGRSVTTNATSSHDPAAQTNYEGRSDVLGRRRDRRVGIKSKPDSAYASGRYDRPAGRVAVGPAGGPDRAPRAVSTPGHSCP